MNYEIDKTVRFEEKDNTVTLVSDVYQYTFGYYSRNPWMTDDVCIMARAKDFHDNSERPTLVAVDYSNKKVYELGIPCGNSEFVVYGSLIYYDSNGVMYEYDIDSKTTRKIAEMPGMTFPHMTFDGKYINWEADRDGKCCGFVCEIATGKITELCAMSFSKPFNIANHMMVCPTDPDKLFFAHEGTTEYISNRLWLAEKGRAPRNIARQHLDQNGNLGDCFGHEMWAPDGKKIWFVKYPCSPQPPRGVGCVDIDTGYTEIKFSKYRYWHVSASRDGKYLGADTQETPCGVVVIDLATGEERRIADAYINWVHPCHPHPCFSPSSKYVMYHHLIGDKTTVSNFRLN